MKMRKSLKRVCSLFLALLLVFSVMPTTAFAADAVETAAEATTAPEYDFGPANTSKACKLIPGIYDMTVQMKKASDPNRDSMAADCIKGGALEVMNDGTAYVNVVLGPKVMIGLGQSYAVNWRIYQEHNTSSELIKADDITLNEAGEPTEIRFKLPYTDQDGVFAKMHVATALGGLPMDPDALLRCLYHEAKHNSEKEAAKIDTMIAALGIITLESESSVAEARKSYDWLIPESKALVENLSVLETAETTLAGLKQAEIDKAAASEVEAKIDAIGEVTITSEKAINEARAVYEALTDVQKTYVKNLAILEAAEKQLAELKQQAEYEFGPDKTKLSPGKYDLPLSMMNASNTARPSMAASAVKDAQLEVMDNGDAYVTVQLGSVTMGPITGWSSEWNIRNEYNKTSAMTLAEVVEKDAEGNDAAIRFKLPFKDKDGVYAQMYVAVMTMRPDAFLKMDFAKAAPVKPEKPLFKLSGTSMTTANSLKMEFYIDEAELNGNTDVHAVITKKYADGRADDIVKVPYSEWKNSQGLKYVQFSGVAAKEMMDEVTVQVFDNSGKALSEVYTDSIHDYALRMLKKDAFGPELRTVLVDMLNYGAACQTYFNYNEQNLANASIEQYQQYATKEVELTDSRKAGTQYYGTALTTYSNLKFTIYYKNITPDMYAQVSFTDHYGHDEMLRIDAKDMKPYNDKGTQVYMIDINELAVADVRQDITCTIYNGQGEVVDTTVDSIESYLARMTSVSPVFETIMKFGTSAYAYFHK